jgi:putative transposase
MPSSRKYEASFLTATVLEWKFLLADTAYKNVIVDTLQYFAKENKVLIHAFVIMDNHIHVVWQAVHPFQQEQVQRNFLKYTANTIINDLKNKNSALLDQLHVGQQNRTYQVWKRNALAVDLWSESVLKQKLDYIHGNPVRAGICEHPEDYKYSSARTYAGGDDWPFLTPFAFVH